MYIIYSLWYLRKPKEELKPPKKVIKKQKIIYKKIIYANLIEEKLKEINMFYQF